MANLANPYRNVPSVPDGLDLSTLAASGVELELEIGFGRGQFALARAQARPNAHVLGLEVRRKWVGVLRARAERLRIDNVTFYHGDGKMNLPQFGPDGVLSWAFVHFPDPWWKKKHRKRLVVTAESVAHLARLLEPGRGKLLIQTDVPDRGELYHQVVAAEPTLELIELDHGERAVDQMSHREKKCLETGLPVWRVLAQRKG